MAGALGLVLTGTTVAVEGSHAVPVYVDNSLPIVGPARACVISTGEIPQGGGPPLAVRLAPAGTPAIGPAIPVYVVPGGGVLDTLAYTKKVQSSGPISYWAMAEASGSVALDSSGNGRTGAYTAVTLGAAGIGDGRTAASFDGATSFNNIYTASFDAAWTGGEFTIAGWAKVSAAGVWTDAANRAIIRIRRSGSGDRIDLLKSSTNNEVDYIYVASGVTKSVVLGSFSPTTYFHIAVTVSAGADQMKAYINGAQTGATQNGLGAWGGVLDATQTCVGAVSTVPATVFSGTLAHIAVWNSALSAAAIANLAVVV